MSEIIKTQAIVLRKINFGDTSRIAQFYSEDYGKISAIIKGARSPKSKTGMLIDTTNLLQLILYKKESREVQLVKEIDLIKHYTRIRDDYDKLKYASAIIELITNLTLENDHSKRLFEGTVKIFSLLESTDENPKYLFAKYFLFFIKEIGYEFQIRNCNVCGRELQKNSMISYNHKTGLMCSECSRDRSINFNISTELFSLLLCLNSRKNKIKYKEEDLNAIIKMLEKFLTYNVNEFKEIKSLKII